MGEQSGPRELVRYAQAAEDAGFDFEVSSDHYSPWLASSGPLPARLDGPLGAVAHATSRVELMTYVTCPTMRYHPAVVAQKAATLQLLSEGRFILGVGSGESLNEHVVGQGWPSVDTRQEMLLEAIEIIRELHTGDLITYVGEHFRAGFGPHLGRPRLSRRDRRRRLGRRGHRGLRAARRSPDRGARVPQGELVEQWDEARGAEGAEGVSRKIGQVPVSWVSRQGCRRPARARPVPVVRRRVARGTPSCRRRRASPRRASSSGRRTSPAPSPARPRPRRAGRERTAVPRRRLHRHRDSCRSGTSSRSDSWRRSPSPSSSGCARSAGRTPACRRFLPAPLLLRRALDRHDEDHAVRLVARRRRARVAVAALQPHVERALRVGDDLDQPARDLQGSGRGARGRSSTATSTGCAARCGTSAGSSCG